MDAVAHSFIPPFWAIVLGFLGPGVAILLYATYAKFDTEKEREAWLVIGMFATTISMLFVLVAILTGKA